MRAADYTRLVALAAIWGGAFIFLRVAAPVLGPAWTAELRVLIGGLALLAWFRTLGFDPGLRRYARVYLLLGAALALLPLLPFLPPQAMPSALVIANVLGLALLASGVAFVLYFRLIADVGVTRALTVTYLIPLFGVLWGWLFLGETISPDMLAGAALVLLGTFFVLRK